MTDLCTAVDSKGNRCVRYLGHPGPHLKARGPKTLAPLDPERPAVDMLPRGLVEPLPTPFVPAPAVLDDAVITQAGAVRTFLPERLEPDDKPRVSQGAPTAATTRCCSCTELRPVGLPMCARCWRLVPDPLKDRVLRACREKRPLEVVRAAIDAAAAAVRDVELRRMTNDG